MTKEEAIECLNYQNEKFFGGQSEALKMAISALSAPSTNVISIDQANAMIKSYVSHYEENKGEWISELELYGEGKWNYQCSVCGRSIRLEQNETLDDYPFCHCGADMRGET